MTASPRPSDFEARTNATYDALMWALSRPGLPRSLPETGLAQVIETLIDLECAVHFDDEALRTLAARPGATLTTPDRADHLFLSAAPTPDLLHTLRMGSDLHPEEGATLVCPASFGTGPRLRLTGPGCDGPVEVRIDGPTPAFWAERARVMRYPMGVDLLLIDGDQVIGLPRSTTVEVL
jgi:alpha-D-ribose 1-methylphosphonate 5-triphosphate synthase subunit PhnH